MKNILLIFLGSISLAIGGLGIVLPLLPTTPLVLVSAICFSKSSPKIYYKISKSKYFGEFITNYKNKTGVSKSIKIKALIFLWIGLIISAFMSRQPIVYMILLIVGVGVTAHILMLKSKQNI